MSSLYYLPMKPFRYVAIVAVLLLVGCASYMPAPFDIEEYRKELSQRPFDKDSISHYLSRLDLKEEVHYNVADGIDRKEAVILALLFNPVLRTARANANLPLREAHEAGRWADPVFSLDLERFLEGVQKPWVIGGMLSFALPLSGHLHIERERLFKEGEARAYRLLGAEQAIKSEVENEWLEWSLLQERRSISLSYQKELIEGRKRSERLAELGELLPTEVRLLLIEEKRLNVGVLSIEEKITNSEYKLRYLMGLNPDATVTLVPSTSVTPVDQTSPVELTPQIRGALTEYEAAEYEVKAAIRRQFPDLSVGGGYGPDQGYDRGLFSLSLPLPFINRNRREIARAEAEREIRRSSVEEQYQELLSQVAQLKNSARLAEERLKLIKTGIAPLAEKQLVEVLSLAQAGENNVLLQLETYRALYETKVELLEALRARGEAINRLRAILHPMTHLWGGQNFK